MLAGGIVWEQAQVAYRQGEQSGKAFLGGGCVVAVACTVSRLL